MSDMTKIKPKKIGRRSFVDVMLGSSLFAWFGAVFFPVFRYLIPPKDSAPVQTSVIAAEVGELKLNSGKIFEFGRKPGILINTPEGELRAFTAICTHLDCTVQYRPDFEHIWCACHNGHYDLQGKNIAGPPPRPLEVFDVHIRDGKVHVSKQT